MLDYQGLTAYPIEEVHYAEGEREDLDSAAPWKYIAHETAIIAAKTIALAKSHAAAGQQPQEVGDVYWKAYFQAKKQLSEVSDDESNPSPYKGSGRRDLAKA